MLFRTHEALSSREAPILRAVWVLILCALSVAAQQKHAHDHRVNESRPAQSPESVSVGRPGVIRVGYDEVSIPDVEVLDQNGQKKRFYTDLFKNRVVVVSFFFTSCTLMCPLQGQVLAKLRTALGEKLGNEVFFVSISKDPKIDTPRHLRLWARQFDVGTGWTLVTGTETVMSKLLWDLIGEEPGPQLHNAVLLIGNDRTGVWEDAAGLSSPDKLVEVIERVSVERVRRSGPP